MRPVPRLIHGDDYEIARDLRLAADWRVNPQRLEYNLVKVEEKIVFQ
jgi:hypothetical protein